MFILKVFEKFANDLCQVWTSNIRCINLVLQVLEMQCLFQSPGFHNFNINILFFNHDLNDIGLHFVPPLPFPPQKKKKNYNQTFSINSFQTCDYIDLHIHWASKETYHFFRAMLTKIHRIKMNHIWTQISYGSPHDAHLKNKMVAFVKKEKNAVKLQNVIFSKITETARWEPLRMAAYSEHSIAIHSISKAGYVSTGLVIVCPELRARKASSFCDFWKLTFCDFTLFYSSLTQTFVFWDVLVKNYFSLFCAQLWFILMLYILMCVALKKWCFF